MPNKSDMCDSPLSLFSQDERVKRNKIIKNQFAEFRRLINEEKKERNTSDEFKAKKLEEERAKSIKKVEEILELKFPNILRSNASASGINAPTSSAQTSAQESFERLPVL